MLFGLNKLPFYLTIVGGNGIKKVRREPLDSMLRHVN